MGQRNDMEAVESKLEREESEDVTEEKNERE